MSQANFAPYMECSLELAVDLVNTYESESGTEELTTPKQLDAFLVAHEMSGSLSRATEEDLQQVRRLRSTLRQVFEAGDEAKAAEILNAMMARAGARPELTNHDGGPWHLHYTPVRTPLAPRIAAESAMALSVVLATEGFDRLRVCEGDRCRDVFVDASRNRSRRFCSPQVCGNRASVAAYRARQKTGSATG